MAQMTATGAVPAGSATIEEYQSMIPAEPEVAPEPETVQAQEPVVETQKEEPKDDWQSRYAEAQKLIGRQGTELGNLRKQTESLQQAITEMQSAAKGQGQPDLSAQLKDISQRVTTGDLDIGEALMMTANISTQMGAQEAGKNYQSALQQQKAEELRGKFLSENPDFNDVLGSGELDGIIQANPMHDQFSAYWQLKAQKEAAKAAEMEKSAYEKGRVEGAKLAQGDQQAGKVLAKPGTAAREGANKPIVGQSARHNAMQAALAAVRGQ